MHNVCLSGTFNGYPNVIANGSGNIPARRFSGWTPAFHGNLKNLARLRRTRFRTIKYSPLRRARPRRDARSVPLSAHLAEHLPSAGQLFNDRRVRSTRGSEGTAFESLAPSNFPNTILRRRYYSLNPAPRGYFSEVRSRENDRSPAKSRRDGGRDSEELGALEAVHF